MRCFRSQSDMRRFRERNRRMSKIRHAGISPIRHAPFSLKTQNFKLPKTAHLLLTKRCAILDIPKKAHLFTPYYISPLKRCAVLARANLAHLRCAVFADKTCAVFAGKRCADFAEIFLGKTCEKNGQKMRRFRSAENSASFFGRSEGLPKTAHLFSKKFVKFPKKKMRRIRRQKMRRFRAKKMRRFRGQKWPFFCQKMRRFRDIQNGASFFSDFCLCAPTLY